MELLKLNYFDLPDVYPYIRLMLTDNHLLNLINRKIPENKYAEKFHDLVGYDSKAFELPFISRITLLELHTYLQHTLLRDTDQMSMAHALEVRVPFLDHHFVELVLSVKDEFKYPSSPKKLFTDSMGDLLPKEIINRPKMGFVLPWEQWMKYELRSFVEEQLYSFQKRSIINAEYLSKMWQMFLNGDKRVTWSRIWYLVVLENWLTTHNVEFE
jgi:asparagine synthase (glutamine-hydrolysing)